MAIGASRYFILLISICQATGTNPGCACDVAKKFNVLQEAYSKYKSSNVLKQKLYLRTTPRLFVCCNFKFLTQVYDWQLNITVMKAVSTLEKELF